MRIQLCFVVRLCICCLPLAALERDRHDVNTAERVQQSDGRCSHVAQLRSVRNRKLIDAVGVGGRWRLEPSPGAVEPILGASGGVGGRRGASKGVERIVEGLCSDCLTHQVNAFHERHDSVCSSRDCVPGVSRTYVLQTQHRRAALAVPTACVIELRLDEWVFKTVSVSHV